MFEAVWEGLVKSGWVIIPLMLASLCGWLIVFHRLLVLSGLRLGRLGEWRVRLAEGSWESWLRGLTPRERRSTAGALLTAIDSARSEGRPAMEARLDEAMKFQVPELEKWHSTLAVLASVAPLMGLLGTVSGIVRTFEVIGAFGTGNQALMSDSISESLLATQNGLLAAFPLMLMHVVVAARAEGIEKSALAAAQAFINRCAPPSPAGVLA